MKRFILTISVLACLALPSLAQDKPDIAQISDGVTKDLIKSCNSLLNAFDKGELLIKELESENAQLKQLTQLQSRQLLTIQDASKKLELALEAQKTATEAFKAALALSEQQNALKDKRIAELESRKSTKNRIGAILKIGAIGGATAFCGAPCGIGTALVIEGLPLLRKGKKGK